MPSCPEAPTSGAVSEEGSSRSSPESSWETSAVTAASGDRPPPAASPLCPPRRVHPVVARLQRDVQVLVQEFPAGTPPRALCQALAYLVYSQHGWQVKFCCKSKRMPQRLCAPSSWLDEVVVATTPEGVSCVVDISFRNKFFVRCPTEFDQQQFSKFLARLPEVYIGLVDQLLQDVAACTAALEKVRQDTLPPWCSRGTLRALYKSCVECDPTTASECLCAIEARLAAATVDGGAEEAALPACCLDAAQLDRLAAALARCASPGAPPPFSPSGLPALQFEKEEPGAEAAASLCEPGGISRLFSPQ
eukprot:EG_transcript_6603